MTPLITPVITDDARVAAWRRDNARRRFVIALALSSIAVVTPSIASSLTIAQVIFVACALFNAFLVGILSERIRVARACSLFLVDLEPKAASTSVAPARGSLQHNPESVGDSAR